VLPGPRSDTGSSPFPKTDLSGCAAAHRTLARTLRTLTEAQARRPSLLHGWSVGHVLTHLARNAESHANLIVAVRRGAVVDQYPGGPTVRDDAIEAGSGRDHRAIVHDLRRSIDQLEAAWASLSAEQWRTGRIRTGGIEVGVAELPFRRWREVEAHHADCGLAFGVDDWSPAYVRREFDVMLVGLRSRLGSAPRLELVVTDTGERHGVSGTTGGGTLAFDVDEPALVFAVEASRRTLLAWMLGRTEIPGAPPLGPWDGIAPAPLPDALSPSVAARR
jgi:maleylpyruvate isomerase